MRPEKSRREGQRRSRFEAFEERLALSAEPLPAVDVSSALAASAENTYGDVAPSAFPIHGDQHQSQVDSGLAPHILSTTSSLPEAHRLTGLDQVRNLYGFTGAGQTVVIIDSGIAYDHQALGGGLGRNYQVVGGWDFAENDGNPYDDGPAGFHGTHVAGIVGSNDTRYEGVAPGVDLVALRVLDDRGGGSFDWTEQALQWVHAHRFDFAHPITTVNLSLGVNWNADAPPSWAMLEDEFAQLEADGIFVSVSAGNSFASYNAPGLSYPAASPYVVPVASVDSDGKLSSYSQRHDRVIAAPGRNITSTVPDYAMGSDGVPNDFASASGTSMAAPYVAGAATLIRQAMQYVGLSGIDQDAIYNQMRRTADVLFDPLTNANYLRLNVERAISSLMPTDDYGSTIATAHALGTIASQQSFSGTINTRADVDCLTFTAGATGRMAFLFQGMNDLKLNVELLDGGGTFSGNTLTCDVVAGRTYTLAVGTTGGIGRFQATVQFESVVSDAGDGASGTGTGTDRSATDGELARKAYELDQRYGFRSTTDYATNMARQGEKWLQDKSGQWWFILRDGRLYRWNYSKNILSSHHVATLDASFHADPSKLHAAPSPGSAAGDSSAGATSGGSSSGNGASDAATGLAQRAAEWDQKLGLRSSGNYHTNWVGLNEKWMQDAAGKWYFITPDGGFYSWNGSHTRAANSTQLARFDATFHANPANLHEAAIAGQSSRPEPASMPAEAAVTQEMAPEPARPPTGTLADAMASSQRFRGPIAAPADSAGFLSASDAPIETPASHRLLPPSRDQRESAVTSGALSSPGTDAARPGFEIFSDDEWWRGVCPSRLTEEDAAEFEILDALFDDLDHAIELLA